MTEREFPSKQDMWLMVLLWGVLIGVPVIVVAGTIAAGNVGEALVTVLSTLLAPLVVFGVAWPVRYIVTDEHIRIRSGYLLRWKVPIARIESVRRTRNPLSSPAWSLDRIRIDYVAPTGGRRGVMISPEPREEFYQELMKRVPGLERDGEGLRQVNPIR